MRTVVLFAAITSCLVLPGYAFEALNPAAWQWRGSVSRGKLLNIQGVTGDIRATPSANGEVEVTARIDRDTESEKLELRAFQTDSGVTVCAVRSGAEACEEEGVSRPGGRVDYEVRVPSGVHLKARTVNGGIDAQLLKGDVEAATVNGGVLISTSGTVQASTVNGSIDASLTKPFWSKAPEFSAVNGRISVRIPTNVRSGISAETRNGRIVTDVPKFRGTATEQKLEGRIGAASGCRPMILRTVNGTIELRERF